MHHIECLLGETSALFARGLASVLETSDGIKVIGRADDAETLVFLAEKDQPDIVISSFEPPNDSTALAGRLHTPLIVLTWSRRQDELIHAIRSGVSAFMHKDVTPEELLRSVREVAAGRKVFPAGWEQVVLHRLETGQAPALRRSDGVSFTTRERQIVQLVVDGCSNKELAINLGIAHQTAKNHMHRVMSKVGVMSRVQLCGWAMQRGYRPKQAASPDLSRAQVS